MSNAIFSVTEFVHLQRKTGLPYRLHIGLKSGTSLPCCYYPTLLYIDGGDDGRREVNSLQVFILGPEEAPAEEVAFLELDRIEFISLGPMTSQEEAAVRKFRPRFFEEYLALHGHAGATARARVPEPDIDEVRPSTPAEESAECAGAVPSRL